MTTNNGYFMSHFRGKRGLFLLAGVIILIVSVLTSYSLLTNRPRPGKRPSKAVIPLVETAELRAASRRVNIPAMGTVRPSVEVSLKPQVTGKIIWASKKLIEGGLVSRGETVIKLDPRDYELALVAKKAELQKALYELKVEEGQQNIAKREWQILGENGQATQLEKELALRKPHLEQKKASLEAARASVRTAELNLERTKIKTPFNGIVRSSAVHAGDIASTTSELAVIAGTDSYQIVLSVPVDSLKWLRIPGSSVTAVSSSGKKYSGRIIQIFSDLEEQGRTARLIAEVRDPLALRRGKGRTSGSLLIGEFINAEIGGKNIPGVYKVPAEAVHEGKQIWLLRNNALAVEQIEILWRDSDYIYARIPAMKGRLIVSHISAPVKGMKLQEARKSEMDNTGTVTGGEK